VAVNLGWFRVAAGATTTTVRVPGTPAHWKPCAACGRPALSESEYEDAVAFCKECMEQARGPFDYRELGVGD
jgi:hypothetical protein